jgi:hypothetical protein
MIHTGHPAFHPPDRSCTLWRYMDLAKLLSLLEARSLYFPRSDTFEDPYEGTLSKAIVDAVRTQEKEGHLPAGMMDQYLKNLEDRRREMYISCWFASEHESAAMWKLYLQAPQGVAIRTTHDALVSALTPSPLSMGTTLVQYVDYRAAPIPIGNIFFPFVFKRISFEHERELRALIWALEDKNRPHIPNGALGAAVAIDPTVLISAIHVSPAAPKWFGELVTSLVRRYGLTCSVIHSSLYERPIY